MATDTDTVLIPEEYGVEIHGIERVSPLTWPLVSAFGMVSLLLSFSMHLVFYPLPFSPHLAPN